MNWGLIYAAAQTGGFPGSAKGPSEQLIPKRHISFFPYHTAQVGMVSLLILCSFPEAFRFICVRRAVGANTAAQLKSPCPVITNECHSFEHEFWMQISLLFIAAGKLLFTALHMSHHHRPAALEMGLSRKYDGCVFSVWCSPHLELL